MSCTSRQRGSSDRERTASTCASSGPASKSARAAVTSGADRPSAALLNAVGPRDTQRKVFALCDAGPGNRFSRQIGNVLPLVRPQALVALEDLPLALQAQRRSPAAAAERMRAH